MRLRLDIAYDGTDFHGWAVQPGRRTVAAVLGEALATLVRAPVPMAVAGRTDAGVHAIGQVAHIDVAPAALAALAPRHLRPAEPVAAPAAAGLVPHVPDTPSTAPGTDLHAPGTCPENPDAPGAGPENPHVPDTPDTPGAAPDAGPNIPDTPDTPSAAPGAGPENPHAPDTSPDIGDVGSAGLIGLVGLVGLRRRLAGLLPPDVRVLRVTPAPAGFDARFSALRRHYRYRIANAEWGAPPLRRADTLAWRRPLDVTAMQAAANLLIGLHDFAAYCKPREGSTTIRDLQLLTVTARPLRQPGDIVTCPAWDAATRRPWDTATRRAGDPTPAGGDGNRAAADPERLVLIDVTADAFCHSMVRSVVGALLAVGDGRVPVDRPAELLADGRRTAEIAVAPAHGLTLLGVDYPADGELAARAARTRALRDDPASPPGQRPGTTAG